MTQPRLSPIRHIRLNPRHPRSTNQQKITIMKKLYFYLLFLPLWGFVGIAHASVAVQVLNTNFTNKTVTLRVEYANAVNDRVWVWIYLCSMQGMYQPAEISAALATSGNVLYTTTNTRGFFVTASPATITATLSNAPDPFSCCAYGSDTPPSATLNSGTYTFKGTPPFTLTDADGITTQTVTENTLPVSAFTITPVTITDKTGYPDIFSFCLYTGSDLYMDASHLCQQRTSGAKNWEAWIKDTRDNELYRIVLMPDDNWWLAQNVKFANTGSARDDCNKEECGRFYTGAQASGNWGGSSGYGQGKQGVCPPGWIIPIGTEVLTMVNACGSTNAIRAAALRSYNSTCTPINDTYGFASLISRNTGAGGGAPDAWRTNDCSGCSCSFGIDQSTSGTTCDSIDIRSTGCGSHAKPVRCFRL
jgi:uncharacterized protein (TIGR02145 family)